MKKLILIPLILLLNGCAGDTIRSTNNEAVPVSEKEVEVKEEVQHDTSFVKIGEVDFPSGFGPHAAEILEDVNSKCQYIFLADTQKITFTPYYDEYGRVKGCKSQF